jgi:hypothetical protein
LSFDCNSFPDTNILYIHLFNGQYFNSNIYAKKKIEIEREMLFLLAGKLGVKEINYETEMTEIVISKTDASLNIKGFKNGIQYNKNDIYNSSIKVDTSKLPLGIYILESFYVDGSVSRRVLVK